MATIGQRIADRVAKFGGSWTFLSCFAGFILVWMVINVSFTLFTTFDPYPFILLNLILSCLAAVQAPIIMMSQNRQSEIDRERDKLALKLNQETDARLKEVEKSIEMFIAAQTLRTVDLKEELCHLQKLVRENSSTPTK